MRIVRGTGRDITSTTWPARGHRPDGATRLARAHQHAASINLNSDDAIPVAIVRILALPSSSHVPLWNLSPSKYDAFFTRLH
jgi:hypothetical protein